MTSINLFPIEERQTLRTTKLKTCFRFGSYSSYLEISNESKELHIELDQKVIKKNVAESVSGLSATYSHDQEYLIELFKIIVSKVDLMPEVTKEELATYFVNNINTSEVKK